MEREQEELRNFINLHACKATLSQERRIHLMDWSPAGTALDAELAVFTIDDVLKSHNAENTLVRWTLRQLQTYDVDKEIVIGLNFGSDKLLSHVIRLIPDED